MATITNSIFLSDDDGDLEVKVEDAHDPAICRISMGDAFSTNAHIFGTYEAFIKLKAAIDEILLTLER